MRARIAHRSAARTRARLLVALLRVSFAIAPVLLARFRFGTAQLPTQFMRERAIGKNVAFKLLFLAQKSAIWLLFVIRLDFHLQQTIGRSGLAPVAWLLALALPALLPIALLGREHDAPIIVFMLLVWLLFAAARARNARLEDYAARAGRLPHEKA